MMYYDDYLHNILFSFFLELNVNSIINVKQELTTPPPRSTRVNQWFLLGSMSTILSSTSF
jgi:hypothetical protein